MKTARYELLAVVLAAASAPAFSQSTNSADRVTPMPEPQRVSTVERILGTIEPDDPNEPLTAKVRLHEYLKGTFGPAPLLTAAASAGISQARNSPHEWGQGGEGYADRLLNNIGYVLVRNTITLGASAALHEDNRYFASGKRGVWPRTAHALLSPFVARRNGREVFSISSMTGIVGASAISREWSPSSWQGGRNIAQSAAITVAGTAGLNIVREFMPDLIRRFRKNRSTQSQP